MRRLKKFTALLFAVGITTLNILGNTSVTYAQVTETEEVEDHSREYDFVYDNMVNMVTGRRDVSELGLNYEKVIEAYNEISKNYPWLTYSCYNHCGVSGGVLRGYELEFNERYILEDGTLDKDKILAEREEFKASIEDARSYVKAGMSDVEIALALHNYITISAYYDYDFDDYSFHNYGLFVNHKAVCSGNAKGYSTLLNYYGIENMNVESWPMNHEWNLVKLDGDWYHIDVTWDNPLYGSIDCRYEGIRYDSFIASDEEIEYSGHYGWKDYENWDSSYPEIAQSNSYSDYVFRNVSYIGHKAGNLVGNMSYYDGYWYYMVYGEKYGNRIMVRSRIDGSDYEELFEVTENNPNKPLFSVIRDDVLIYATADKLYALKLDDIKGDRYVLADISKDYPNGLISEATITNGVIKYVVLREKDSDISEAESYTTLVYDYGKNGLTDVIEPGQRGAGLGDINGDNTISSQDAVLLKQYLAGYSVEDSIQKENADVNGDGNVNSLDAVLLMQKLAGYDVSFGK